MSSKKEDKRVEFCCRLSNVGTNNFNASYKMAKDKSALKLIERCVATMIKDMVPEEVQNTLRMHLAVTLLNTFEQNESYQKTFNEFMKRSNGDFKFFFKDWEIRSE